MNDMMMIVSNVDGNIVVNCLVLKVGIFDIVLYVFGKFKGVYGNMVYKLFFNEMLLGISVVVWMVLEIIV